MDIATLDFESYWDQEHTLKKIPAAVYVMHPKTQLISVSLLINGRNEGCVFGEDEIRRLLGTVNWRKTAALGHNMSVFDSMILAWRLGIKPAAWLCTLAMARVPYGKVHRLSLAALVQALGIGVKNQQVLLDTRGKRLEDFTADELRRMAIYNTEDSEQCWELFKHLRQFFSAEELWHLDCNIRMLVEPEFELDRGLLEAALSVERSNKRKALLTLARHTHKVKGEGWDNEDVVAMQVAKTMQSAAQFSALLTSLDVDVPMKRSPKDPKKWIPAIAKTDEAMQELLDHDDEIVAAAARARLSVKSTQLETRIQSFLSVHGAVGKLPVPVNYCGADTTGRDSGFWYNCFAGDVEVLTPAGWVRFDAWDGAPVMQWWPDGRLTFEDQPGYLAKPYDGPLVAFDGPLVSGSVTPDHRVPLVRGGRVADVTAEEVTRRSHVDGIPVSGMWAGGSGGFTPEEARVMVAIAADGHVHRQQFRIGVRKHRKLERAKQLLAAAGIPFTVREYPAQAGHSTQDPTFHVNFRAAHMHKGFGPWLLALDRAALDAVVDELQYWDGWLHPANGQLVFSASSPEDAAWVATALHLSGVATRPRWRKAPGGKPNCVLYARKSRYTSVTARKHTRISPFSGTVYCASVASTYLLVRHGGRIFVSGQCLNLPRVNKKKPSVKDALRRAIAAPKGALIGVCDLSGIELRVNHTLWKVQRSMDLWRADPEADLYSGTADAYYELPAGTVNKEDPRRQLGKVLELSCGFQIAGPKLRSQARAQFGLRLTPEEAVRGVHAWRARYPEIADYDTGGWARFQQALADMAAGVERAIDPWGLVHTVKDGMRLPSGRLIRYPDLRQEWTKRYREVDGELVEKNVLSWVYAHKRHKAHLYGGKCTENAVQAIARDIIFGQALQFWKDTGWRPKHKVYDELCYVWPEAEADALLAHLQECMRTPPKWWPEIVLACEGSVAERYADCK